MSSYQIKEYMLHLFKVLTVRSRLRLEARMVGKE